MKVRINITGDTIVMKFLRTNADTKLEGYILGYGSSMFSRQFIQLPKEGQPYETEFDAEPKYLIAVQPIPTNEVKKQCTGKVELEKPLHLVIGSVTPTSVFLSWGTLLKTPYEGNVMNDCLQDGHYTVRYREKNRKWNYQKCPTSDTVIDNLQPNTLYEFGVQPSSKDGIGVWSKPVIHNMSTPNMDAHMQPQIQSTSQSIPHTQLYLHPYPQPTSGSILTTQPQLQSEPKPRMKSEPQTKIKPQNEPNLKKTPQARPTLNTTTHNHTQRPTQLQSLLTSKTEYQVQPTLQPATVAQPTPKTEKHSSQPKSKTESHGKSKRKTKAQSQPKSKLSPKNKAKPKLNNKFLPPPKTKKQTKTYTRNEQELQLKIQPWPKSHPPIKPHTQPVTHSQPIPLPQPSSKSQLEPLSKPTSRPQAQTQPGPQIQSQSRTYSDPTKVTPRQAVPTGKDPTRFDINENSTIFRPLPTSEVDIMGKKRYVAPHVIYKTDKKPDEPCSITSALTYFPDDEGSDLNVTGPPRIPPSNLTVVTVEGCPSFIILDWQKSDNDTREYEVVSTTKGPNGKEMSVLTTNQTHTAVENLKPESSYEFTVIPKNELGTGPSSDPVSFSTESADPRVSEYVSGKDAIWTQFPFKSDAYSECNGKMFVKRTWYRKFVGIQLCNSLRYKIYLSDSLTGKFYNIGDQTGYGEDHCQFVDSFLDGRTGSQMSADQLPNRLGFYRAMRQEPVSFGQIGGKSHSTYVGWYECGTPIPGKW
uniref:Fibronectin type-III domain-containing protein n=1 Tax=Mola mola TaxID=94237 RepID=A0A3Q3XCI9_MOLML